MFEDVAQGGEGAAVGGRVAETVQGVGEGVRLELEADFDDIERRDDEPGRRNRLAWETNSVLQKLAALYLDTRPATAPAATTCSREPYGRVRNKYPLSAGSRIVALLTSSLRCSALCDMQSPAAVVQRRPGDQEPNPSSDFVDLKTVAMVTKNSLRWRAKEAEEQSRAECCPASARRLWLSEDKGRKGSFRSPALAETPMPKCTKIEVWHRLW